MTVRSESVVGRTVTTWVPSTVAVSICRPAASQSSPTGERISMSFIILKIIHNRTDFNFRFY